MIGFTTDVIPITTNRLNMFDPIKFPMAKSLCFFNEAATEAASSGILVPIATIVILIILSDTLNLFATDIDDFIKVSAPSHKIAALITSKKNDVKTFSLPRLRSLSRVDVSGF